MRFFGYLLRLDQLLLLIRFASKASKKRTTGRISDVICIESHKKHANKKDEITKKKVINKLTTNKT